MAINKAMRAALKALSYPDPDIKKSYKMVRRLEKLTAKRIKNPKGCVVSTAFVEREGYNIPVRIFEPADGSAKEAVLFFHGGGWVNGDIDTYADVCVEMQKMLARTVVSVDYRRAPEHKFPAAPEDCYAAAKALFSGSLLPQFMPDDIIIMGDSAGGNLAAVVSLMARDRGDFAPKRQVLIYPATGNDHDPQTSEFASIRENSTDYLLTSKRVVGYMELYASCEADLQNPYLAPLLENNLQSQPNTLVITAQYCPLRDEGEEYGRRLAEAGNKVSVYRMPDAIHGYFSLPVKFKLVKKTYAIIKRFLGDDRIEENKPTNWAKLDNAAKIFPPTTTKRDAKVFRFYCQLCDRVDPRILQSALDDTMESYAFYRSILKKGVFWYYFEDSALTPVVREEYKEPCSQLYDSDRKGLLFEVTYYRNRINFEVYHALTDGEGASKFFRTLVARYVEQAHRSDVPSGLLTDDSTIFEKIDDSFFKYYKEQKTVRGIKTASSYHIRGERLSLHPLGVIEGEMPVHQLLDKAHGCGCTLSALLIAVLIRAIAESMPLRDRSKLIVINVPVDLRQYFESKSARNFFGLINVEYDLAHQSDKLEDIIGFVSGSMKKALDKRKISERMSRLSKIENLLPARIVPLIFKDPGMRVANMIVERSVTAAFSNLGRISLPPEFSPHIEKFGIMSSTKRLQACMCSYNDRFMIGFTSPFVTTDVQCRFFRTLAGMGVDVNITSNLGSDSNVIL